MAGSHGTGGTVYSGAGGVFTPGRLLAVIIAVIIVIGVVQLARPTGSPVVVPEVPTALSLPGAPPGIPWPTNGEATLYVQGIGSLGTSGSTEAPTWSVAKMMTAYILLKDHPLTLGSSGPTITVSSADVADYNHDVAIGASVAAVTLGEQLSEYEALQLMLIPSGCNIAWMLAQWDAGSQSAFVAKMNATAKALGMDHTHYVDASGLSPATVSTPSDQLIIMRKAMAIPVFAEIVGQPQMTNPATGKVDYNYNADLGKDGIIGVKTGNASNAVFAFEANRTADGQAVTIDGVIMDVVATTAQPSDLAGALQEALSLVNAAVSAVTTVPAAQAGMAVAKIVPPWGSSIDVVTKSVPTLVGWGGLKMPAHLVLDVKPTKAIPAGDILGDLVVGRGSRAVDIPVAITRGLGGAPIFWRLTRF